MRFALAFAGGLLIVALVVILIGTSTGPLNRSCGDGLSEDACSGAVRAVMLRGLPDVHPLILAAHVEAGSAPGAGDLGHRATVTFDLLGLPDQTDFDLFYDQGGHWGGESDREDAEITTLTFAPLFIAGAAAMAIVAFGLRRHRRRLTG
jgi:hypothetical protein